MIQFKLGFMGWIAFVFTAEAAPLTGYLDLRPSWVSSSGTAHTENEVGALYELNPSLRLGFVQEFQTRLYSPETTGPALEAVDGYAKAEIPVTDWLEFEPRVILPTAPAERDAGLIFAARPIAKLTLVRTPVGNFEVWESPILPVYEVPSENRSFANRAEFIYRVGLWEDRIALKFPLIWLETQNPEGWETELWINPEAIFSIAEKTGVGLAYYSENFVGEETSFADGLRTGVAQVVFQQEF